MCAYKVCILDADLERVAGSVVTQGEPRDDQGRCRDIESDVNILPSLRSVSLLILVSVLLGVMVYCARFLRLG